MKHFYVTYEEQTRNELTGNLNPVEIKKTRVAAESETDAFFFIIDANRWIRKIEEVKM